VWLLSAAGMDRDGVARAERVHAHLTAIVSVADDGGSSGEIRRDLGILPPVTSENCLAALSDDEALLTQLFQYRFGGETGLGGIRSVTCSFQHWLILPAVSKTRFLNRAGRSPSMDRCSLPHYTMSGWWRMSDCHIQRRGAGGG